MMYYENLLFLNIGGQETILIIFAILLLFGGKKLPELAKGLGKGMREFKDASDGVKREIHRNINSLTAEEELKRDEAEYKVEEEDDDIDPYDSYDYNSESPKPREDNGETDHKQTNNKETVN